MVVVSGFIRNCPHLCLELTNARRESVEWQVSVAHDTDLRVTRDFWPGIDGIVLGQDADVKGASFHDC